MLNYIACTFCYEKGHLLDFNGFTGLSAGYVLLVFQRKDEKSVGWIVPDNLAHYVEKHQVPLPGDFIDDVMKGKFLYCIPRTPLTVGELIEHPTEMSAPAVYPEAFLEKLLQVMPFPKPGANQKLYELIQALKGSDVHAEVDSIIAQNEAKAKAQATATVYLEDWGQMYRKPNGTWVGGGDQFPSSTELAKKCEELLSYQSTQKGEVS